MAVTTYTVYTTLPGDRWDLIAFKAYGDVSKIGALLAANRGIGAPVELPANVTLRVPILTDADLVSPDLLPPWKQ